MRSLLIALIIFLASPVLAQFYDPFDEPPARKRSPMTQERSPMYLDQDWNTGYIQKWGRDTYTVLPGLNMGDPLNLRGRCEWPSPCTDQPQRLPEPRGKTKWDLLPW